MDEIKQFALSILLAAELGQLTGNKELDDMLVDLAKAVLAGDLRAALQLALVAQLMLQQQQQSLLARFGAKLNYIRTLNGICPEGYETLMFKAGGRVCKKCVKKKMQEGGQTPSDPVKAFKCGRKMSKCRK